MTTMKNIINLTPHEVKVILANGEQRCFPASGQLARVTCSSEVIGDVGGIPVMKTIYGEVEGLPAPKDGVVYLVSSLVAGRCGGRDDVFVPNDSVRDESGRIIGCRSLARI